MDSVEPIDDKSYEILGLSIALTCLQIRASSWPMSSDELHQRNKIAEFPVWHLSNCESGSSCARLNKLSISIGWYKLIATAHK